MSATLGLDSSLSDLPKVGPAELRRLERLGLATVRDLIFFLPYDVDDYGAPQSVAALTDGALGVVTGELAGVRTLGHPRSPRGRRRVEAELIDGGHRLRLVWFNQDYVAKRLEIGTRVTVAGKIKRSAFGAEMVNPRFASEGAGRVGGIKPRYHLTQGLTRDRVENLVGLVLDLAQQVQDEVPDVVRRRQDLVPVADALRWLHRPSDNDQWHRARRRMAFAELFGLQAAFILTRSRLQGEPASPIAYRQEVIERFKAELGFELTRAQRRAIWEVFQDLERSQPMNRLLNGDVGSGKTAVAAAAIAMAHSAGLQSVVMAPTDILARQHLQRFRAYLEGAFPGLRVELLVGRQSAAQRRAVLGAAAAGQLALLVGTQALIEDAVEMAALGLVVVDEQHRFGTRQRELLRAKSPSSQPHFLAMTATPIPRTLALALYGEMNLSTIDELPPGRVPVSTRVIAAGGREEAYALIRSEVASGHQAFVICPIVEESESLQVRAASAEFERLRDRVFPDLKVLMVHGRMRDKDVVMEEFGAGGGDVLVATPVIEVGVDVPNATVMLIEGADRFGLAQLHQFRGRVGRGSRASHCLLLADDASEAALERLQLMASIHDGFELARRDLTLRGSGELMGVRQHGAPDLAMDALLNPPLLSEAREEAEALAAIDPTFATWPELRAALERRLEGWALS